MSNELTNEQIARVFAMYMWCECVVKYPFKGDKKKKSSMMPPFLHEYVMEVEYCKLLLTPLSSISDEDAIEVGEMRGDPYIKHRPNKSHLITYIKGEIEEWCEKDFRIYQYLIQRGYAVPLFIEPNHPLNGKTAIEIGLAIDKTKEAVK